MSNANDGDGALPNSPGGVTIPVLSPPASSPVDQVDPTEAAEALVEPSLKEASCSGDANNDAAELEPTGIAAAADPEIPKPPEEDEPTSEKNCNGDNETTKQISWAKPSGVTDGHDTDVSGRDAPVPRRPRRKSKVDHRYRDFSAIGMMEAQNYSNSAANDDTIKAGASFPQVLHRILSQPAYNHVSLPKTSTTCDRAYC